jgi:hypothetical protein
LLPVTSQASAFVTPTVNSFLKWPWIPPAVCLALCILLSVLSLTPKSLTLLSPLLLWPSSLPCPSAIHSHHFRSRQFTQSIWRCYHATSCSHYSHIPWHTLHHHFCFVGHWY